MTEPVLSLPLTRAQALDIIHVASPSLRRTPYGRDSPGRGEEHCYQLDADKFTIKNSKWCEFLQRNVDQIKVDLSCGPDATCELNKLLLCEPGGFFKVIKLAGFYNRACGAAKWGAWVVIETIFPGF